MLLERELKSNLNLRALKNTKGERKPQNSFYEIEAKNSKQIEEERRETIASQCLDVANSAGFPTDYQDVYEHLFGSDFELSFIKRNGEIKGFAVVAQLELAGEEVAFIHGAILDPKAQSRGMMEPAISPIIEKMNAKYIMSKTHNPRAYAAVSKLGKKTYPNYTSQVPEKILEMVRQNPFISSFNDNLVVKNAYLDEKIQQPINNEVIINGFKENVDKYDAQVFVVELG